MWVSVFCFISSILEALKMNNETVTLDDSEGLTIIDTELFDWLKKSNWK